ncbi:MAG TPA: penicillin acylase family protein [Bacteroidales bacterium]|nr:penicillin acylase family protein [Bacteroidales bacterium]
MKILRIIIYGLAVLLVIIIAGGFIFISGIRHSGRPRYSGELELKGLNSGVTVYRDERGVPHIYAKDEHDLYFAVGYVMAQERLWQMDLIRRATTGRLSEIFGKDFVNTDLFLRSLDMTNKSKLVIQEADPTVLVAMKAYCDGVNSYIAMAGKKLPPEFRILSYTPEPWKLEDQANIIGYMGWDLAKENLNADIENYRLVKKFGVDKANELIPDWKAVSAYVFPEFKLDNATLKKAEELFKSFDKLESKGITTFTGSNNWAVAGRKTWTGKPVMSNDMHLGLSSPGIWIQMHEVVPGKLNVTGVVVPGQPFVVAGHNERIAWGETNLMVDDIDLYMEKINPADSNQYFFNGSWKNMLVREEIIKIKGGTEVRKKLRFTHRGPVISGFRNVDDAVLTMRWSGYDKSDEIKAVYLLNRASNWQDFRTAISSFRSVSQNFVYADVDGNIGLNTGGAIPLRKGNGTIIRNGETSEFDWKGYVPFEQLPSSFNPDTGYVSSANNRTVTVDYPYFISAEFVMPFRINRIRQMLNEKQKFDIEDFKRMITDQHSNYAAMLTPFILKLEPHENDFNPLEKAAFETLKGWDYDMNKDQVAPSVFEIFHFKLQDNLLADELGDLYRGLDFTYRDYYVYRILTSGPDEWVDDISTPGKETLDDIMLKSFKGTVSYLSGKYGSDISGWKWGDLHKIRLVHPLSSVKILDRAFSLNSRLYRIGGSDHTVAPYSYDSTMIANHGASERHIFNTADWDESLTVIPTGNSGVPGTEFYLSQLETYLDGKFYKDHFSEQAVKSNVRYTLRLIPGK